jgi:hypothetical protein
MSQELVQVEALPQAMEQRWGLGTRGIGMDIVDWLDEAAQSGLRLRRILPSLH